MIDMKIKDRIVLKMINLIRRIYMACGRITYLMEDKRVRKYFSPETPRRIPLSIYYPTSEKGDSFYKNIYEGDEDLLRRIYSDGKADKTQCLENLKFPFINNAESSWDDKKRNLIIFSHGFTADRDFFMFMIPFLVSSGYAVITVGHLYDTDFTLIPGTSEIVKMKEGILSETSFDERDEQISARAEDISYVLSHISEINSLERIEGMIREEEVMLMGHSLGGMTVLKNLAADNVSGCIMLDGSIQFLHENYIEGNTEGKKVLNYRRGFISYEEKIKYKIEKLKDLESKKFKDYLLKEHEERTEELEKTLMLYEMLGEEGREYFIYQDETHHLSFSDYFIVNKEKYDYPVPLSEIHKVMCEVVRDFADEVTVYKDGFFAGRIREDFYPGIHMQNFEFMESERDSFRE